jgi:hypothetical protein
MEELIRRIKFELSNHTDEGYQFNIGNLEVWHSDESYEVRRTDLPYGERLVVRGERRTNAFSDWGDEALACAALALLRQRQVLEDMADA